MPLPAELPTVVARMPSSPPAFTNIRVRLTAPPMFESWIPVPVDLRIAPPVQLAALLQVAEPVPLTVKLPVLVLLRRMAFAGPLAPFVVLVDTCAKVMCEPP